MSSEPLIFTPVFTTLATTKTVSTSKNIIGYNIINIGITLGVSATILVALYDSSNSWIENKTFVLSGTNYTNWGSNDIPYIDAWVVSQIEALTSL